MNRSWSAEVANNIVQIEHTRDTIPDAYVSAHSSPEI